MRKENKLLLSIFKTEKAMINTETYVGELIRTAIRHQFLNNTYVIQKMKAVGHDLTDTKFSNKLGGIREKFTKEEVEVINDILGTKFSIPE